MAEFSLEDMVRLVMVDRVEWMVTSPKVVEVENSSNSSSASRRDDEASEATSVGGNDDEDDGEFPMLV